ncbi:hypothetical protein NC652_008317 [Populus alba x Populus x berolinensis]|nr:hypothetical protein NC652_008317 [Populus alba x Populus x berolinensis]
MKQTMQSIVENVLGSIHPFEKRRGEKQEENKFSQASLPG